MSYPSESCGCGRTDGCRNCRPITINEVIAAEYPKSIEAALDAERKAHAETKARLAMLIDAALGIVVRRISHSGLCLDGCVCPPEDKKFLTVLKKLSCRGS